MPVNKIARIAMFEEVAERLRARIFAHDLAPGTWIDEQTIAAEYGISRTPMREALKVLAAEGLVELRPGKGCYVTCIEGRDLDEIFPILALLEGRCAYEAARRMHADALQNLQQLHAQLEAAAQAQDIGEFFRANQAFHLSVQEIAGNRWLVQVIQDLRKVLKLSRYHSLLKDGRLEASLSEHRAILEALASGNCAAAQQLTEHHLLNGRAAIGQLEHIS